MLQIKRGITKKSSLKGSVSSQIPLYFVCDCITMHAVQTYQHDRGRGAAAEEGAGVAAWSS